LAEIAPEREATQASQLQQPRQVLHNAVPRRVTTMNAKRPMVASVVGLLLASCASAEPVKVELRNDGGNWQLLRGGQPFFIQGAGGDHSKKVLKELGGNSFRTWGADNLGPQLDEAQRLGLTVTAGIWLGHERHGFDYADPKMVKEQFERARAVVLKHKDHPALLMWGVGNEMEGPGGVAGDNPLIWKAVDDIAAMIKREDPNHPPMTVVAELSGPKVAAIHKHCRHVEVVGINSYGGGRSVARRYREAGGTKPFVVTEFGPAGMWEVEKTEWGAPIELTSTRKADNYRATYEQTVLAERGKLALGSYAFIWGHKQEGSATWFGLFLPGGERLEAADVLSEFWTGRKVANRCPQILPLKLETPDKVKPGEIIRLSVDVSDPENDPVKIEWSLTKVPDKFITSGDPQKPPPAVPDAVVKNGERTVEIKVPNDGGGYWLYCIARDNHGGAATATLPLHVEASAAAGKSGATKARLPLVLYGEDAKAALPYVASGWMGNHEAIAMDDASTDKPHSGKVCMKLEYKSAGDFAGIVWQDPANDWGDQPGGYDLSGAKRLTFWARGAEGGEQVEFKFGILDSDKPFPDTASGTTGAVTLKKDWTQYTIDLAGRDLTRIKTGFCWSLAGQGKPVTFYLDDVRYE
jgi:hypothetical protein